MTGYHFHPETEIDLNEIWDCIAAQAASVKAAIYILRDLHNGSKSLATIMPRSRL